MQKTLPYHSNVTDKKRLELSPKSVFKVYFLNSLDREDKEKYLWEHSPLSKDAFLDKLRELAPEGIGFIIAFPHICKIFRFGPETETNLNAAAYHPHTMEKISLKRNGWSEVACSAEMAIGADEFDFWVNAESVEEYLSKFSEKGNVKIRNHIKLYRFVTGKA